ncbi:MAG: glycosyltransferase family 2 protein [Chitinophagales bacterium]|nr:glycosyltransferase family 2 protein [Chitinophagales bacterium]
MRPLVSIITVNYNQTAATCALLDSIRRQHYRAVEVIVVDNASKEDPAAHFATHYPEALYLRSASNLGFAGGNNLALPHAKGDFLFFVNNDAELTPEALDTLLVWMQQHPDTGILSPLICYYPEKGQTKDIIQYAGMTEIHPLTGRNRTLGAGETDNGQYREARPTAYAHGAAMLVRRAALEQAGPMQEDYFLYYEELDWCARMRRAGWQIAIEPRAKIYHKESLTTGRMGPLKTYYMNRNRVQFMRRHVRGWKLALFYGYVLCFMAPKNILQLALSGQTANLRAFCKGLWWHISPQKQAAFI